MAHQAEVHAEPPQVSASNQVSMHHSSESSDADGFPYEMAKQLALGRSNSESSDKHPNKDEEIDNVASKKQEIIPQPKQPDSVLDVDQS